MVQQLKKTEKRVDPFRNKFTVDSVARAKLDPNFNYKLVIYDDPKRPLNYDLHADKGYEVVTSTDELEDDRKFSPDNKLESSHKPKPVTKRTKDGFMQVLMRISKEQEIKNKQKEADDDLAKYARSSGSKIKKVKNQVTITGTEVDTTSNDNNSNNEENLND